MLLSFRDSRQPPSEHHNPNLVSFRLTTPSNIMRKISWQVKVHGKNGHLRTNVGHEATQWTPLSLGRPTDTTIQTPSPLLLRSMPGWIGIIQSGTSAPCLRDRLLNWKMDGGQPHSTLDLLWSMRPMSRGELKTQVLYRTESEPAKGPNVRHLEGTFPPQAGSQINDRHGLGGRTSLPSCFPFPQWLGILRRPRVEDPRPVSRRQTRPTSNIELGCLIYLNTLATCTYLCT